MISISHKNLTLILLAACLTPLLPLQAFGQYNEEERKIIEKRFDEEISREVKQLVQDIRDTFISVAPSKIRTTVNRSRNLYELDLAEKEWKAGNKKARDVVEAALPLLKDLVLEIADKKALSSANVGIKILVAIASTSGTIKRVQRLLKAKHETLEEIDSNIREQRKAEQERIARGFDEYVARAEREYKLWTQRMIKEYGLSYREVIRRINREALEKEVEAASRVVEGLTIVSPEQGIYGLEKISGINPDFIESLLRCQKADQTFFQLRRDYRAPPEGSSDNPAARRVHAALDDVFACNKYKDGSYIPAFGASRKPIINMAFNPSGEVTVLRNDGTRTRLGNSVSKKTSSGARAFLSNHPDLHKKVLSGDLPPEAKSKPIEVTDGEVQSELQIPRGWVACHCPEVHVGIGIIYKGTRYHPDSHKCPQ